MRLRNIAAATTPALILAAALVAAAPRAHADGGREGGACRRGASLATTPQPAIMAPVTIATAASPATMAAAPGTAAPGTVQIPGLGPRGGCGGGSEGEHHAHRREQETGRPHTDD